MKVKIDVMNHVMSRSMYDSYEDGQNLGTAIGLITAIHK